MERVCGGPGKVDFCGERPLTVPAVPSQKDSRSDRNRNFLLVHRHNSISVSDHDALKESLVEIFGVNGELHAPAFREWQKISPLIDSGKYKRAVALIQCDGGDSDGAECADRGELHVAPFRVRSVFWKKLQFRRKEENSVTHCYASN